MFPAAILRKNYINKKINYLLFSEKISRDKNFEKFDSNQIFDSILTYKNLSKRFLYCFFYLV